MEAMRRVLLNTLASTALQAKAARGSGNASPTIAWVYTASPRNAPLAEQGARQDRLVVAS
jgi:hypothetical protein